jgi:hypothetical protein
MFSVLFSFAYLFFFKRKVRDKSKFEIPINWDLSNPLRHLTVTAPPEGYPMKSLALWESCQQG